MPTVIDSLVLTFNLDPSQFTRGQQQVLSDVRKMEDEAQRTARDTETTSKKLGELFTTAKREMLGFLGIAIGGAEAHKFFDFITNLDATTGRLSRTLGINVEELSAWQSAAKAFGGTGQEVVGTIMRLEQEVWNFRFGAGSNLPGQLRALGISVFDQNNQPKTGVELLREMASAVEHLQMPTAGKAAFLRMLGIDETTINMVIQGRAELEKIIETMRRAGTTTRETAAETAAYQRAMGEFTTAATNAGRSLVRDFLPGLTWLIEKFTALIELSNKVKTIWPGQQANTAVDELHKGNYGRALFGDAWDYLWKPGANWSGLWSSLGGGTAQAAPAPGAATGGQNWTNFLSGLSYLETSQQGGGNAGSSAEGYFQFLQGTAARARGQGISDPRYGSYGDQAAATRAYIEKNYPGAAAAIQRGDFSSAIAALNQEWPSLPGGSQPQSAARYATFGQELRGGGPRPPGASIVVQQMTVNSRADNAAGIAGDIKSELTRSDFASQAPQGTQ